MALYMTYANISCINRKEISMDGTVDECVQWLGEMSAAQVDVDDDDESKVNGKIRTRATGFCSLSLSLPLQIVNIALHSMYKQITLKLSVTEKFSSCSIIYCHYILYSFVSLACILVRSFFRSFIQSIVCWLIL